MPRAEPVVRAAQRLIGKLRLRTLEGRSSGRLLDVGSGKGHFLDAARRAGWTVTGLEYSEAAAKEGRRRYGVDTIIGDWASAPLEGPYDVISMWHVLEHLDDPREALRRARALIAPDGLLVVSVPNSASLQARLFRGTWFHLDLPRHLYHFTPRALRQLVESAGFEVAAVDTIAPEMEVIGVVASVANRLGGEPNAALRFLKRDATVRSTTAVVAAFAVAALFAPLAGILAIVAPAVGRGASIQLVARPAIVSTEERRPTA
jgi:ubiquinone/menaquinone biosynthesis C-methylase UbiE